MARPKNLLMVQCDADLCDRIASILRDEGVPLETTTDQSRVLEGLGTPSDRAIVAEAREPGDAAAEALLARRAFDERLSLRELEDLYIDAVLEGTGGNKVQAARILGINRRTLYRRAERRSQREARGED